MHRGRALEPISADTPLLIAASLRLHNAAGAAFIVLEGEFL
jgi:hypothetical protein